METPIVADIAIREVAKIGEELAWLDSLNRNLEADGLVLRKAYAEVPPRVEYSLTERSLSLMPLLNNLVNWALDNFSAIIHDRQLFAERD